MTRKNISLYAITFFIVFALEFGLLSYLSHAISKENYLFYVNIINLLPFISTLIGFGAPFAIVYMSSIQPPKARRFLLESNFLSLYIFLALFLLITVLYLIKYSPLYAVISIILGFFLAIKQNTISFFLSKKDLKAASFVRLNQKIIFTLTVILPTTIMLAYPSSIFSILLISGEIIGFIVLQLKYQIIKPLKFTKIKSIFIIAKYSFLGTLISSLTLAIPIFSLNRLNFNIIDIASFAIAFSFLKYSSLLLAPFIQLIIPILTPLKNDIKNLKIFYYKYLIYTLTLGVLSALFLYFCADSIINFFFSNQYKSAANIIKKFSWCVPLLLINSYSSTVISSIGGIKSILNITIIMLLLMLILSLLVLPRIGIYAYSEGISVYFFSQFVITQYYLHKSFFIKSRN